MAQADLKGLYDDLKREYDLTLDRRKTLTGLATNLTSFAGIIQTVLVALLISVATSKDVRALLLPSVYFPLLAGTMGVGFFSYILTAFFSLMAFREPKWMRIPEMPDKNPLKSIRDFYEHPDYYEPKYFALQLGWATEIHQKTNDQKYDYLRIALIFLLFGIVATAIGGLVLLL